MLLPTIQGQPVLLPSHNDIELNQPITHYHLDPRFIKSEEATIIEDKGEEIVYREFPDEAAEPKELNFGISMYLNLLNLYEGRKLCGTHCPHRGIEVFHNGQCMGHGLRFDKDQIVKGRLKDCFLLLPKSANRSKNGCFDAIKIVEFMPKVTEVWLVCGDVFLAKNKIGPMPVQIRDTMKMSFNINDKSSTPPPCPPQMDDSREQLALRASEK